MIMSENKEYVSRSDELGNIHISEEVLAVMAAAATTARIINRSARDFTQNPGASETAASVDRIRTDYPIAASTAAGLVPLESSI